MDTNIKQRFLSQSLHPEVLQKGELLLPRVLKSLKYAEFISIPHICKFRGTTKLIGPGKGAPKCALICDKKANNGQNGPKLSVFDAKGGTVLKKVHHPRSWQVWLIWAMSIRVNCSTEQQLKSFLSFNALICFTYMNLHASFSNIRQDQIIKWNILEKT